MQGYKTPDRNAEDGVPVELGFVQFLTRVVNREGKSTIEFDESTWCDFETERFLSQNAKWTGYPL